MGRYTGFIALGLMIAAAAVYSFLQADAPVARAWPPASPQAEMPSTSQDNAKPSDPSAVSEVPGSGFDFYVLSLSWSPTFCDSEAAGRNRAGQNRLGQQAVRHRGCRRSIPWRLARTV